MPPPMRSLFLIGMMATAVIVTACGCFHFRGGNNVDAWMAASMWIAGWLFGVVTVAKDAPRS